MTSRKGEPNKYINCTSRAKSVHGIQIKHTILEKHKHIIDHPKFAHALKSCTNVQREIITGYLEPESTFRTIGDKMNMPQSEASRYFHRGIEKISRIISVDVR